MIIYIVFNDCGFDIVVRMIRVVGEFELGFNLGDVIICVGMILEFVD